jgi:hypothetical protein
VVIVADSEQQKNLLPYLSLPGKSHLMPFDFNTVIPSPCELQYTHRGHQKINGNKETTWITEHTCELIDTSNDDNFHDNKTPDCCIPFADGTKEPKESCEDRALTPKEVKEFNDNFGSLNWYDWNVSNWGTKWTAVDCVVKAYDKCVVYNFITAYGPPYLVYDKLQKQFNQKFDSLRNDIIVPDKSDGIDYGDDIFARGYDEQEETYNWFYPDDDFSDFWVWNDAYLNDNRNIENIGATK